MSSTEVIDPNTGTELFVEQDGERRIPWGVLVDTEPGAVTAFLKALSRYMEAHPRLEVRYESRHLTDELVVRWRWHR